MRGDVKTSIRLNSVFLGFSIGLGIGIVLIVSVFWFSWIWDEKYKQLRAALFFGVSVFIVLIRKYWELRRSIQFWLALSILAIAHATIVWLFMTRVRSLSPRELIVIAAVECFPAVFLINWFVHSERMVQHEE
jgi:hypothetical protein